MVDKHTNAQGEQTASGATISEPMKLLSLDSSLAARKELAKELYYDGDLNNSASMNIWLHKQIMVNLAANGGKLPDELKHLI